MRRTSSETGDLSELKVFRSRYGSVVFFQIYYDDFTAQFLDPAMNPVFNAGFSPFLESQVILDLIENRCHEVADRVGVFSWRMGEKLRVSAQGLTSLLEQDRMQHDILSFPFERDGKVSVWANEVDGKRVPGPLLDVGNYLLKKLGYEVDLLFLDTPLIFQNAFIAKKQVMERYCIEMLKPALMAMSDMSDLKMQSLLSRPANYKVANRIKNRIAKIFGIEAYRLHPFVAERLLATWISLKIPLERPSVFIPTLPPVRALTF